MASIIVYLADTKYINRTLSELVDKTPSYLLEDVIVCNDTGHDYKNDSVLVLNTDRAGRSKCWNDAAKQASSDELVFLRDTTKLSREWLQPLIARVKDSSSLVSPKIHTLNTDFWSTENESWERFGWRWDLSLYSRTSLRSVESPSISSNCIVVTANWFEHLGGFDEGMSSGVGEDIEISLRSWLFDGKVEIEDDSSIAVRSEIDNSKRTVNNLARIVEIWMPQFSSRFFAARGIKPSELNIGRLANLMQLQDKRLHSIDWFLERCQPELNGLYDLRGIASGKSVAVIGPGSSIDLIDPSWVYRHDIIIAVDYMGLAFEADYVVTDSSHVAIELKSRYNQNQFVLPLGLSDVVSSEYIPASAVIQNCYQFEVSKLQGRVISDSPPFCNFDQSLHSAVNFAIFLQPRTISLFGCDNKIINGKSHSAKIEYYDDGKLWPDSDAIRKKFVYSDFGIDQLGKLASSIGIPLIRVNHA